MDKGNKVKTTDMTALQSDLVTIATGMKPTGRGQPSGNADLYRKNPGG